MALTVPDAAICTARDAGSKTPDIGQTPWDPIVGDSVHWQRMN